MWEADPPFRPDPALQRSRAAPGKSNLALRSLPGRGAVAAALEGSWRGAGRGGGCEVPRGVGARRVGAEPAGLRGSGAAARGPVALAAGWRLTAGRSR